MKNNIIHDIEELAELQKELCKYLRGKLRREKLIEEIFDVEIAIKDIKDFFNINDSELNIMRMIKNKNKSKSI